MSSIRAQKLAEDLLGLDIQSTMPQTLPYRGKVTEGIMTFYVKNKKPIMYAGGAALVAGAVWVGYKLFVKKNADDSS